MSEFKIGDRVVIDYVGDNNEWKDMTGVIVSIESPPGPIALGQMDLTGFCP